MLHLQLTTLHEPWTNNQHLWIINYITILTARTANQCIMFSFVSAVSAMLTELLGYLNEQTYEAYCSYKTDNVFTHTGTLTHFQTGLCASCRLASLEFVNSHQISKHQSAVRQPRATGKRDYLLHLGHENFLNAACNNRCVLPFPAWVKSKKQHAKCGIILKSKCGITQLTICHLQPLAIVCQTISTRGVPSLTPTPQHP